MELIHEIARVINIVGDDDNARKKVISIVRELLPEIAEDIIDHTYDVVMYLSHNKKLLKRINKCRCF